jgi:hypothetical protein
VIVIRRKHVRRSAHRRTPKRCFDKNTGDASDIPNEKRHHANAGCRRNGRTGYREAVGIGRVTRTLPLGLGPRNTIEARMIKIFIDGRDFFR